MEAAIEVLAAVIQLGSTRAGPASKLAHKEVGRRSTSTLTCVTMPQKSCFHVYSHGLPYRATLLHGNWLLPEGRYPRESKKD